jgi:hypothetical protein
VPSQVSACWERRCGADGRRIIQRRRAENPTEDKGCNGGDGRRQTSKLSTGLALRMYRLGSRDGIRLFESGIHCDGIRLRAAGVVVVAKVTIFAAEVRLMNLRRGEGRRGTWLDTVMKEAEEEDCWVSSGPERRKTCTAAVVPLWKKAAARMRAAVVDN